MSSASSAVQTSTSAATASPSSALDERGFEPHRDGPVEPDGEEIDFDDRDRVYAVLPGLSVLFYDRALAERR